MFLHPLNPVSYFCGYHSLCCCLISCHVYRIHLVCCPEPPANHRDLGAQGERGWWSAALGAAGGPLIAPNIAVRGQQMEMSVGLGIKEPCCNAVLSREAINQRECVHGRPLGDLILHVAASFQTDSTAA